MWSTKQRQRLEVEHQVLQGEGFTQFSVYHDRANDTYYASGWAVSSSGYRYGLYITIPPDSRPTADNVHYGPISTPDAKRTKISDLGTSHYMHTLAPSSNGMVQICHWRDKRWHSGILLYKVFLKGLLWIEAYEQHLATGRNLSEFVGTMTETA